jgi:hypothetical protein
VKKLHTITFGTIPRLPGLRPADLGKIDCDNPGTALAGWRLILRNQSAFFVSPPGWTENIADRRRDPKGAVTIYEMARTEVLLRWHATGEDLEDILKGGKFESPPFGWKPAEVVADKPILAQVPVGQLGDA